MSLVEVVNSMEVDSIEYNITSMEVLSAFETMVSRLEKLEDIRTRGMLKKMMVLSDRLIELREEWDAFIVTLRRESLEAIHHLDVVAPDESGFSSYD